MSMFWGSGLFSVFNRNAIICTRLKPMSAVNQRKTIGAAANGCLTCAGGTRSKNVFTYSNPPQISFSGDDSSSKVFFSNSVYQEKSALSLNLQNSRSFAQALAAATSRTVSKEERSTIVSTMCRLVNDMNVIDLCQTVCR
jgi:hypothetical protein